MTGKTKWFSPKKGYGFILGDDGNDYFVHYSQIKSDGFRTLTTDQPVIFDLGEGRDGKQQAMNVVAS